MKLLLALALMGLGAGDAVAERSPEFGEGKYFLVVQNYTAVPVQRVLVFSTSTPTDLMPKGMEIQPGETVKLEVGSAYGPCLYRLYIYFQNDELVFFGEWNACDRPGVLPEVMLLDRRLLQEQ